MSEEDLTEYVLHLGKHFQRKPHFRSREDFEAYCKYHILREKQKGPQSPDVLSEAFGIPYTYFLEMVQLPP